MLSLPTGDLFSAIPVITSVVLHDIESGDVLTKALPCQMHHLSSHLWSTRVSTVQPHRLAYRLSLDPSGLVLEGTIWCVVFCEDGGKLCTHMCVYSAPRLKQLFRWSREKKINLMDNDKEMRALNVRALIRMSEEEHTN